MKNTQTAEDLLTMAEAADRLKTTRTTLYRWLRDEKIVGMKTGRQWRFQRSEVERFLKGNAPQIDLPSDPSEFLAALENEVPAKFERGENPMQDAFQLMVQVAVEKSADSFHLACCQTGTEVEKTTWLRFRVSGDLVLGPQLDNRLLAPLVKYWKQAAACDPRETSLPQDGLILVEHDHTTLSLTASFLPSLLGESLTVRVQDRSLSHPRLENREISETDRRRIREALVQRSRVVIVSGLSSTEKYGLLATCLNEIAGPSVKLMTVAHPAWGSVPWATHLRLRSLGSHPNYATAIGTILRSDPDVIAFAKLGEAETVSAAQDAALSGALVIAGAEFEGAVPTLKSLLKLADSPTVFSPLIELIVSQRQVRCLCKMCSAQTKVDDRFYQEITALAQTGGLDPAELKRNFRHAVGCHACGQSGYRGRKILTETLRVTSKILRLLGQEDVQDDDLVQVAVADGMVSHNARVLELVCRGDCSVDEAAKLVRA